MRVCPVLTVFSALGVHCWSGQIYSPFEFNLALGPGRANLPLERDNVPTAEVIVLTLTRTHFGSRKFNLGNISFNFAEN